MPVSKARASKGKSSGAARSHRERAASGEHHQPGRSGLIGSQQGKNPASMRDNQPSPLMVSLRGRNGIHVDLMTMPTGACLLDNDSKLLKAMEDLYPVVSAMKGFQDNTRWSMSSPMSEVFHILYLKFLKAAGNNPSKIVLKNGTYRFMVKAPVFFDVDCPVTPVYWFPAIEKLNRDLFDLCFYLVILLWRQSNISLWNEDPSDYIIENIQSQLADYKTHRGQTTYEKEIAALEQAWSEHNSKGPATRFCERLHKRGASKKIWLQSIDKFKPKTKLEKDIYEWLLLGKELVIEHQSINKFISLPLDIPEDAEQYEELPSTPDQTVRFVWKVDDWWFGEFEQNEQYTSQNAGSLPFYFDKVIAKPSDFGDVKNCFPSKLIRFMAMGRTIESRYRKIFRDENLLKKALNIDVN